MARNILDPDMDFPEDDSLDMDEQIKYLRSIDQTLKNMLKNGRNVSQTDARDAAQERGAFRRSYDESTSGSNGSKRKAPSSFSDGLEEALMESLLGADFKEKIGKSLNEFADLIGVDLQDIPGTLGKELGNQVLGSVKNTDLGKKIFGGFDKWKDKSVSNVKSAFQGGVDKWDSAHPEEAAARKARQAASKVKATAVPSGSSQAAAAGKAASQSAANAGAGLLGNIGNAAGAAGAGTGGAGVAGQLASLVGNAGGAGAALSGLSAAIVPLLPILAKVAAVMIVLELVTEALGPAIEGTQKLFKGMSKAANRYSESREKNLKFAEERLTADIETMVKTPFKILEDAAQKLYDNWDNNLRVINATQGYNKADLQDLMSVYAQRLRDENLTKVVSGTDITDNLKKVLESGLSGRVAEEFAYQATKLNAAVPTQEFFGYADTYASLAANAIRRGESEAAAIKYANSQMELFASNVLYASRQLAGGFTTGLKDAQDLFDKSVQIAQASRTGDPSQIAGVLTSVAAITGAIAPDLASSMTDAIVKAATGGNSSELVALRSMAGINASNTEFLRALAKDPQKVFSNLFSELAKRQNMSESNYMEVAEGLSNIFGISMDAFSRIDFNYLSKAISSMNVSNASLEENMKHLASGETTVTAEQLRMQRINQYMIDEGLAYVLDNEAARAIQQHMWDEQMQRELMEATYAVELKGAALEFLEGIRQTVDNIIGFLNPFSWINKIVNLVGTAQESAAQDVDIRQLLELGKVGKGNAKSLYQLTTRNADLNLTPDIISLMGGVSAYQTVSGIRDIYNSLGHTFMSQMDTLDRINSATKSLLQYGIGASGAAGPRSQYRWGTLGKSTAAAFAGSGVSQGTLLSTASNTSNADLAKKSLADSFSRMTDENYIKEQFVDKNLGYEQWAATASRFGISDLEKAMDELGYTETQLRGYFQAQETKVGAERERARIEREEAWWLIIETNTNRMVEQGDERIAQNYTRIGQNDVLITQGQVRIDQNTNLHKLLDTVTNIHLKRIQDQLETFYKAWESYILKHEVYNNSYKYSDVERVKRAEAAESGTALTALAKALTENTVDLRDPVVQTNAFLAQILLVVEAIMQQNNKTGNLSIPDALSAMATGMFTTSG